MLAKSHEYDKCTPFSPFSMFLKIDGNASLSKPNIEAGERENLFSGEFKADFCQTFNASIVESCKILYDLYRIHSGFSTMVTVTLNSNVFPSSPQVL